MTTMVAYRQGWPLGGGTSTRNTALLITLLLMVMAPRLSDATCTKFLQLQRNCITSSQTTVALACNNYFKLTIVNVTEYRLTASCPSALTDNTASTACQQTSQTTSALTQCPARDSISSCSYTPTQDTSVTSCTGSYFVETLYTCTAVFRSTSDALPSTGSSITITSTAIVTTSAILVGSGLSLSSDTTHYFSVYVPPDVEVNIFISYFTKSPASSSCSARVEVVDIYYTTVAQFCSSTSPAVNLGCGNAGEPRYLLIRYVTGAPVVKSFFGLKLMVPQSNYLTTAAGTPPFPLYPVNYTTQIPMTVSTPVPSTAPWTTAGSVVTTPAGTTSAPVPVTTANQATTLASGLTTAGSVETTPAVTTLAPVPVTTANQATTLASGLTTAGPQVASSFPMWTTSAPAVTTTTKTTTTTSTVTATSSSSAPSSSPAAGISSSTTNNMTTTPAAQTVSSGWNSSATTGVIVGSVIAGSIVFLAIVIGACYGFGQTPVPSTAIQSPVPQAAVTFPQYMAEPPPRTANYQLDPRSNNTGPFRHVTQFYVDGNTSSNLVLSRKQEPQIFKTVIKV